MSDDQQQASAWTVEDDIEASIKPCPRCGGKAILEGTLNDEIVCNGCGMWTGEDMSSLDEAIEWWNSQPLIAELLAMIDELINLAYRPDHNWTDSDYALRNRIHDRYKELATLRTPTTEGKTR